MNIYCIRHVEFEGPGVIEHWANERNHELTSVKTYIGDQFPNISDVEALIIMGGPMSVYEEDKYDWLILEKQLLRAAVDKNIPVLGICLGAQLLANALGGEVYTNMEKEIGWHDVDLTRDGRKHALFSHLPNRFTTFHWHGDTFDLPENALHLASSAGCEHQAFVIRNALGLQFHMEMTEDGIGEVTQRCAHELVEAPYIQTAEQMMDHAAMSLNHQDLGTLLDVWIAQGN